jgi:hypothetical protein
VDKEAQFEHGILIFFVEKEVKIINWEFDVLYATDWNAI